MKNLKYLAFGVVALLLASCDDKPVEYNYSDLGENTARFKVWHAVPCASGASNNIYQMDINGVTYVNNGAAVLSRYNRAPATNLATYSTKPGDFNITLYKSSSLTKCYEQTAKLEAGESSVWIYDYTKTPAVFKEPEAPADLQTENDTIAGCAIRVYNFIRKTTNSETGEMVPVDYKIQVCMMRTGGSATNDDDYEPYGEPIAFGEATDWFVKKIKKTSFNSSGYATERFGFRMIVNGKDEGWVKYINSSGKETIMRNHTLTAYFGRSYRIILTGITDNKTTPVLYDYWTER